MRTVQASTARPRKSALRINKQESLAAVPVPRGLAEPPERQMENRPLSAEDLRQLSISEFAASLREGVSKRKRPYQEHTITDYADAARALGRWMAAAQKRLGKMGRGA